ncbi:uncharacterized protein LOC125479438 [Pyrus x bretschneideri]|uniref:uncharacterized protein LOC125479438 n=1 Tax=Pyrus x bretschneideri TaxID=225117 RepID=UPI00202DFAEB|nr:uncharacterized protein LOC125479438 [Pyrus x bretschneideri]
MSYSFLANGETYGYMEPSRGLRQRDPLSPYLFLLCIEGLSALIVYNEQMRVLSGIRICEAEPSIHHLLFADDIFLFGKTNLDECAVVQRILGVFSQASGHEINLGKTSIAFSANVHGREQQGLANFLGVQLVERHVHYLGHSTFAGKNKRQTYAYIKERVHKRLSSWKGKCLSGVGRELLVKVVAQALPTYAMNCFVLPKTFCDELHQLMARFWWGSDLDSRKIHWQSRDKLCIAKPEGGMGFWNLYAFNLEVGATTLDILSHNDAASISRGYEGSELIDVERNKWCDAKLTEYFKEEDREHIRALPISYRLPSDKLIWHYNDWGIFTVKSAYWVAWNSIKPLSLSASSSASAGNPFTLLCKAIWNAKVPPKVRNMVWRTCHNILLTKENLSKKGILGCGRSCTYCSATDGSYSAGGNGLMPRVVAEYWVRENVEVATKLQVEVGRAGVVIRDA